MQLDETILGNHWLYEWIDEEGIRTPGDYMKAIRRAGSFDRLHELSDRTHSVSPSQNFYRGTSVVAGRQLDMSGFLGCSHFECVQPVVDNLFGRLWHYFDCVVIEEVSIDEIMVSEPGPTEELLQRVRLLLYLRKIGAENYVKFTHKVGGMCSHHFRKYAEKHDLGIDALFNKKFERLVVQKIASEGRFAVFSHDEGWHYEIRHPDIGVINQTFSHSDMSRRPSNEEIARDAFGAYCCGLIRDVSAARALRLPLVQAAENNWRTDSGPDERIVALNLRLPVLRNAPVKEILRFRDDNQASFEVFRAALRDAIRRQIKELSESDNPVSAEEVANAVVAEELEPKLSEIKLQLGGVKKSLGRKLGDNIVVAGAIVDVGLLEHIPAVIAVTAAAAATSVAEIINKRRDDQQEIQNHDLYFLWKAQLRFSKH
jgi:hypothetical protein